MVEARYHRRRDHARSRVLIMIQNIPGARLFPPIPLSSWLIRGQKRLLCVAGLGPARTDPRTARHGS